MNFYTKLKSVKKSHLALVISPVVTIGLFAFMGVLIFQDPNLKMEKTPNVNISFLRNYQETAVENMERKKPEKPEEIQPPDTPPMSVSAAAPKQVLSQALQSFETFDASTVGGSAIAGGIGAMGATSAGSDGNNGLTPLIRVQCDPPRQAKIEGIKGQITLQYNVNKNGTVENVQVVQGNPPRVFDQSCVRAVLQWRFKPKMVDGKAIAVNGNKHTFTFDYSGETN